MTVDIQRITRTRSDTYPFTVTFRDGTGELVDLTGASFILTVNAEEDPTVSEEAEFTLVGVIDAPLTGVVEFTMSESDANRFGLFYYDIQMTDAQGYIRTMMRGPFEIHQDITKNEPSLWTAEGKSAVDGTDGIYWLPLDVADTWEYTLRDTTPVLRVSFDTSSTSEIRGLVPLGWPPLEYDRSFRVSGLFYTDWKSYYMVTSHWTRFEPETAVATQFTLFNEETIFMRASLNPTLPDPVTQIPTFSAASSATQTWVAGWLQWEMEWDAVAREMSATAWQPPADKPGSPLVTLVKNLPAGFPASSIHIGTDRRGSGGSTTEIAWIKLEYI